MERLEQDKTDNKLVLAYMELIITAFFWGLATVLMKKHIDEIPTFHLIASRFLVGALVVFLLAPKKIFTIDKKDLKVGTILGTLNFVTYAFIVLGLNYTSASKTGFLASLSVLFVPIVQSTNNISTSPKDIEIIIRNFEDELIDEDKFTNTLALFNKNPDDFGYEFEVSDEDIEEFEEFFNEGVGDES